MSSDSQSQLNAFTTPHESTADHSTQSTTTPEDSEATTAGSTTNTPLDDLYEAVREAFEEAYPRELLDVDGIRALSPDRDVFVTSDLPDGLEAVPTRVGQWELDYHDDTTVTFRASGRVFDERYGEGGSIVRHRVYLNDAGMNRDGKWHHTTELATGYGNPKQVRTADTSEKKRLSGIRGHSAQKNAGDYGVYGGTQTRYEDARTAVASVIAQLHTEPSAIRSYLPDVEDSEWTLTKHGIQTATYKRAAPPETDYDYLRLSATTDRVYLKSARDDEPAANHEYAPVPIPDSIPAECVTQSDRETTVVATALTPPLLASALERPVPELLEPTAPPQAD